MIIEPKQATHYNCFVFLLLGSYYVTDMTKKLELCLLVFRILIKTEFKHIQISVPKIGKPMSKISCINPCPSTDLVPLLFLIYINDLLNTVKCKL